MKWWTVLATMADGTNCVYGPFRTEEKASEAFDTREKYTDWDCQVIPVTGYSRKDFSIYT
jgi:hypothetical protein